MQLRTRPSSFVAKMFRLGVASFTAAIRWWWEGPGDGEPVGAGPFGPHPQPLQAVEPVDELVIHLPSCPFQQHMDATVPIAHPGRRQILSTLLWFTSQPSILSRTVILR